MTEADAAAHTVVDDIAVTATATHRPDEGSAATPENIQRHDTISSIHVYGFIHQPNFLV